MRPPVASISSNAKALSPVSIKRIRSISSIDNIFISFLGALGFFMLSTGLRAIAS